MKLGLGLFIYILEMGSLGSRNNTIWSIVSLNLLSNYLLRLWVSNFQEFLLITTLYFYLGITPCRGWCLNKKIPF